MVDGESSKQRFCGHCEKYLSKSVYYRHRRLYYNKLTEQWSSTRLFYRDQGDTSDARLPPVLVADEESDTGGDSTFFLDNEEPIYEGSLPIAINC